MYSLAIVTPVLYPLSETFIYNHVVGLRHLHPWVLCARRENQSLFPAEGVDVITLPSRPPPLAQRLWERLPAKLWGRKWTWYNRDVDFATRLFEDRKPSVILAEYGTTGLAVGDAAAKAGVPLAVHFHGHDASRALRSRAYRKAILRLSRTAAAFVVVADKMKQNLLDVGVPASLLHKIPYGVDTAALQVSERPGGDVVTFLHVGRLWEKKGILYTIRAFAAMINATPNARLNVVGDGGMRADAEALAMQLGIRDKVGFLGALPHARVLEEMRRADVFVQHSVTARDGDEEGLPVAILEAAALGLPVVSTRHAGIPEEVIENESGFLTDERDVSAFAEAMGRLAGSAELRVQMGQRGRRLVEERFDLQVELQQLAALLKRCVEEGPA